MVWQLLQEHPLAGAIVIAGILGMAGGLVFRNNARKPRVDFTLVTVDLTAEAGRAPRVRLPPGGAGK